MKRESIVVLEECIDLQKRKSQDYQNPKSNIVQAMHYRRGLSSIHDMIHQKLLRAQSLLEPIEQGGKYDPNFESLEDTYKDLINYASFAVSYIRGSMEGQQNDRDLLNRKDVAQTSTEWTGEVVSNVHPDYLPDKDSKGSPELLTEKLEDVGDRIDQSFSASGELTYAPKWTSYREPNGSFTPGYYVD